MRNERGKMIPSTTAPVHSFLVHHNIMPANFITMLSGSIATRADMSLGSRWRRQAPDMEGRCDCIE
jgi:hypothetical protein